jgi:DNA-binding CsgD family transcriptional regulator
MIAGEIGCHPGELDINMLSDPRSTPSPETPVSRVGDIAAMLRVMRPLNSNLPDATAGRRRLLADLCRFIGVKVGTLPPEALGFPPTDPASPPVPQPVSGQSLPELSPRQEQTLQLLLEGDSEKQVARKLELSKHTVHVYVKELYRRFEVSTRAELLAKHVKR